MQIGFVKERDVVVRSFARVAVVAVMNHLAVLCDQEICGRKDAVPNSIGHGAVDDVFHPNALPVAARMGLEPLVPSTFIVTPKGSVMNGCV